MNCSCQDSNGTECKEKMSQEEYDQDGMCGTCADHVWNYFQAKKGEYTWTHNESKEQ